MQYAHSSEKTRLPGSEPWLIGCGVLSITAIFISLAHRGLFVSLSQLLNAIQLFGANLDDYLHLLLPPIVKLFDAPDAPLPARK